MINIDTDNNNTASADTLVTTSDEGSTASTPVTSTTTEPESDSSGQSQDGVEAGKPEDLGKSEDTFFDPNQVPEELKPAYKQMQAAFTRKTQEIAEARKAVESLKTKAEAYDKYQHLIPIVEEMLSPQNAQNQVDPDLQALEMELKREGYSEDAIKMMQLGAKVILNRLDQKNQASEQQKQLETGILEAEKVDPRLNDEKLTYQLKDGRTITFGEMVARVVFSNPEWTKDPVGATREAIDTVDALIGKAKTEGKEELSNSARTRATKFPSVNSSPQSAAANSQPKSIHEAAEEAKKELGMK